MRTKKNHSWMPFVSSHSWKALSSPLRALSLHLTDLQQVFARLNAHDIITPTDMP